MNIKEWYKSKRNEWSQSKKNKLENKQTKETSLNFYNIIIVGKVLFTQIICFSVLFFVLAFSQKLYSFTDGVVFPDKYLIYPTKFDKTEINELSEEEKGIFLLEALVNRLEYELNSSYGWSANDFIFNKYIMDNRAYRQFGTYVATKMLLDHYSTVIAKLGNNDRENQDLYEARLNHIALSPSRWGVLFIPSAESAYKKALKNIDKYKKDLLEGKAIYNARTDDIHSAFDVLLGETIFGYALGLLHNTRDLSDSELDNKIYETQGVMLVVRDYVNALYHLYPEIAAKGNQENFDNAMKYLDLICNYNPLYITNVFNSGELIISYLLFARNRLEDIRESIKI